MPGEDDMRPITNQQILCNDYTPSNEAIDFTQKRFEIDDDPVEGE